jgi:phosphate:Na+ symporter
MTFATGFAIFFWGIRFLSQGLQDVFGTHIKEFISRASLSKSKNILAGFLVSLVVQSKGITAGMIFELANAGLVRLSRGLWLISGANLATILLLSSRREVFLR